MDIVSILLVVLRVAICALVAILATRKSIGQSILNLVAFALSFLISLALICEGIFNFVGTMVSNILLKTEAIANIAEQSPTLVQFIASFVNYMVNTVVFTIITILLYILFAIIVKAILKSEKISSVAFFAPSQSVGIQVVTGIVAFITAWLLFACIVIPTTALLEFVRPTIEVATSEEDQTTYTYEMGTNVEETLPFLTYKSVAHKVDKYSGSYAFEKFTLKYLGNTKFTTSDGETYTASAAETVTSLLKAGVSGVNIYEKVQTNPTYGSLVPAVNILDTLVDSPLLANIARDFMKQINFKQLDDMPQFKKLLDEYIAPGGDKKITQDIECIRNMAADFMRKNADEKIDPENLAQLTLDYLTDKETSETVAKNLTNLSIYNEAIDAVLEYGLQGFCEALELDYTKDQAHTSFIKKLAEVVNNKERGKVNFESLNSFISNLSATGNSVSSYREDESLAGILDNYDRYMSAMSDFKKATNEFGASDKDFNKYFSFNGKTYVYSPETDTWTETNTPPRDSLVFEHLLTLTNTNIDNNTTTSTEDLISELKDDSFVEKVKQQFGSLPDDIVSQAKDLAEKYSSSKEAPFDITLGEDIVKAMKATESTSDDSTESLADILRRLGEIYRLIQSKENFEDIYAFVLENFGEIGRLLDSLRKYEKTKDLPEYILKTLSRKTLLSEYVDPEQINNITDSVNKGETTYESLFSSIAAMYKLATLTM